MADWATLSTTTNYATLLTTLQDRLTDVLKQLDGLSPTNLPSGARRFNSSTGIFESWNGTTWSAVATQYARKDAANTFAQPQIIGVNDAANAGLTVTQANVLGNHLFIGSTKPFVIDGNQVVIVGHTAKVTQQGLTAIRVQLHGQGGGDSTMSIAAYGTTATNGPQLQGNKSRNTTLGAHTIVQAGDELFDISAGGSDGTAFVTAGALRFFAEGTPAAGVVPGVAAIYTADSTGTMQLRLKITSGGSVQLGGIGTDAYSLRMARGITGATTAYGIGQLGDVQSDVTVVANGFYSNMGTAAAAFTLPNMYHFRVAQGTIGAGSTVTNQYGFSVTSAMIGGTNNYGFHADIASGTNRWNFYASGTANNAFAGNTRLGGTTAPTVACDVTGDVLASAFIRSNGATSGVGYGTGAGGTVTQATSKSTGVTLSKVCGQITMNAAALAAATIVSFVATNTAIAATDVLVLNHVSGGTPGAYTLNAQCAAGSATINVRNNTAGSLSEAIVISYALVKAVTA